MRRVLPAVERSGGALRDRVFSCVGDVAGRDVLCGRPLPLTYPSRSPILHAPYLKPPQTHIPSGLSPLAASILRTDFELFVLMFTPLPADRVGAGGRGLCILNEGVLVFLGRRWAAGQTIGKHMKRAACFIKPTCLSRKPRHQHSSRRSLAYP
ncbi:hypothetical protein O3P69_003637 [Scylla paramamosain]|uniref:Uncharacterized protein n=1 Tax=Scylla paramamosain TaxID=85552 RepID=A0AAW0UJD6_SCYPA